MLYKDLKVKISIMNNIRLFAALYIALSCSYTISSELKLTKFYGPFVWSDGSVSLMTDQGSAEFDPHDPLTQLDGKDYIETKIGLIPLSDDLLAIWYAWLLDRQTKKEKNNTTVVQEPADYIALRRPYRQCRKKQRYQPS